MDRFRLLTRLLKPSVLETVVAWSLLPALVEFYGDPGGRIVVTSWKYRREGAMSNEQVAPETKGVTVKSLAKVELGPEIAGRAPPSNAHGDHRACRRIWTDAWP